MQEITPVEGERAFSVHKNIIDLKKQMGVAFIRIGELLKRVRDNKLYIALGYDSFQSYVINSELGFKRRTAYSYIEVYEWFVDRLQIEVERLVSLGLDKLLTILPMVKKENGSQRIICQKVDNLMHEAAELRPCDFEKKYKDEKKQDGFDNYVAPPEYVRCEKCGKWKIIVPFDECCPDWIFEFIKLLKKKKYVAEG